MDLNNTIDETELIRRVAAQSDIAEPAATAAMAFLTRTVLEEIARGKIVALVGIGTFAAQWFLLREAGTRPDAIVESSAGVFFIPSPTLDEHNPRFSPYLRPIAVLRARRGFEPAPAKAQLVMRLSYEAKMPLEVARRALDSVVEQLRQALLAGADVQFGELGVLSRRPQHPQHPYADLLEMEDSEPVSLLESEDKLLGFQQHQFLVPENEGGKEEPMEIVKIFFGTDRNRNPKARTPADYFGNDRGKQLRYGVCEVSIPHNHRVGKLESPFMLRSLLQDPQKHVVLMSLKEQTAGEFGLAISRCPHKGKTRRALIFVHGFNTTFEDAARRAAQIAYDVEFSGVPFVYSWPSGGKVFNYVSDGSDAEQAIHYFQAFILTVMQNGGFDEVVILAHSMGNRVLAGAITLMMAAGQNQALQQMTEVVFAAPDIDTDVFKNQIAPSLAALGISTTLYASSNDKALKLSKKANGAPRAGDAGRALLVLNGVETVDASAVETSLFGLNHSYIGSAVRLTGDLHDLIENRFRAAVRYGLRTINVKLGTYWCFKT